MGDSVSGSGLDAAKALEEAAQGFVDEIQGAANAGVDLAQTGADTVIHTALGAVEMAIAALKDLVAKV